MILLCFKKYRYLTSSFNRPGFTEMIEAIEDGYIGAVMVKDMSRLGRDYLQVGLYTDQFFPEHGVRFIAVNDGVDSAEGENEFAPFRNIMNQILYESKIVLKKRHQAIWD